MAAAVRVASTTVRMASTVMVMVTAVIIVGFFWQALIIESVIDDGLVLIGCDAFAGDNWAVKHVRRALHAKDG